MGFNSGFKGLMELEVFFDIFLEKDSNIKFHENLSSGSRVVSCGRTGKQRDTTKLVAAFRNSANAPKNSNVLPTQRIYCYSHGKDGYANAPHYYFYTYTAYRSFIDTNLIHNFFI